MKLRALVVGMGLLCTFSSFAATELRYGLEAEYPPFESKNAKGELEGFDIELGNAICKAAKMKCAWEESRKSATRCSMYVNTSTTFQSTRPR